MTIDALSAANAYRNQLKMMQDAGDANDAESSSSSGGTSGSAFAQLVENAAQNAMDAQHQGEAMEMGSLTGGNVDLSDLVTAVANAELSLNTVIAVRDRVINAYNDIIKMSI